MRYSYMSFSTPELTFEEMLQTATRFGYDAVEPRIQVGHAHGLEFDADESVRDAARHAAAETGVDICCLATSCRYADPETAEDNVADTHSAIDLAGDVGAPRIRVFGGGFPETSDREEATDLVARCLEAVADHAAERDVVVCMETHDSWCDPDHVAEVMRRVDRDSVAVNWDIMHPVRTAGKTMDEAFAALEPWIRHIHFHDGKKTDDGSLVMCPVGEGYIDHERALVLLAGIGYDGCLSGEWINWEPWEEHLPRELATMKAFEEGI